jgi:hypothetical protein
MQLKPAFCAICVATCSACMRRSRSDHAPGTTITGVTFPSSLVIGFASFGRPSARRRAASSPVPHTMASCVARLPVTCTLATPGWAVRRAPTSAPP